MTNLKEFKTSTIQELKEYQNELKTGDFSRTELYAYKQVDRCNTVLKGIKAVEKFHKTIELQNDVRTMKEFDRLERIINKQKEIVYETLPGASPYDFE